MGDDSLFGRDDDATRTPAPAEGVRLIGADEAAEAVERGEAVKRLGADEKKYGDRPEPPPPDLRPAMRFPLADSADVADLERPRPVAVEPPSPTSRDESVSNEPVISVGMASGETQLPHWTEPATGEVPRVIIGNAADDADDAERWQAFASSAPRWRDQTSDWNLEENLSDDFFHDEGTQVGALDERERIGHDEFLTFDDLDIPDAAAPTAPARGSADDPIRIHTDRRPPSRPLQGSERGTRKGSPTTGGQTGSVGSGASGRNRTKAIQVGLGIATIGVVFFVVGGKLQWVPLALIIAAVGGCLAEFFTSSNRAGFRPIVPVGIVAAVGMPVATYFRGEAGMMLALFLATFACMAWYLLGVGKGRPVANIVITIAGVVYIVALGSYAALLLRAGPHPGDPNAIAQGNWYFFLVALGTTTHDVAGYLLGSKYGKTRLSKVSPNKTLEGLVFGMAAAAIVVVIVGGALHIGFEFVNHALILGLVIAVVSPIGDLFESMLKRDLGVKDMGAMLPAHGGLLDRFDGYLFTLPAAYYTLRLLGLIP